MPFYNLTTGQIYLLRLIVNRKRPDGWTQYSEVVRPSLDSLPSGLIVYNDQASDQVKLTPEAEQMLRVLAGAE